MAQQINFPVNDLQPALALTGIPTPLMVPEQHNPEPPLLPGDEKERKAVGLAEQWGDEVLQPMARRIIWVALRRSPDSMASYGGDSSLPIPDAVTRLTAPW